MRSAVPHALTLNSLKTVPTLFRCDQNSFVGRDSNPHPLLCGWNATPHTISAVGSSTTSTIWTWDASVFTFEFEMSCPLYQHRTG